MKNKLLYSCLASFLSLILTAQTVTITVSPSDKKQNIIGMGAQYNTSMVSDLLYDIGISTARLWFGAGTGWWDEPVNDDGNPATLDLTKFTAVSTDKVNAVKEAVTAGVKFYVTVGSPPIFMKDTNSQYMWWRILQAQGASAASIASFRYAYDAGGTLRTDMLSEFGEFVMGSVKKYYEQIGSYPYAVSPQNEPEFPEPYFSCKYSGAEMVNATNAIGDALAAASLSSIKIIFAEQTFVQNNVIPWATLANNDANCKNYVSIFAEHAYSEDPNGGGMASPSQWASLLKEANRVSPVKEVWQTEGGPGYGTQLLISIALGGASEFYKAMRYGNCNMFAVYGFGKTEAPRYYSIKNMIRYIRPGAYRVTAGTTGNDTAVIWPLVFKHDTHGSTTIYVVNNATTDKTVKFSGLTGTTEAFQTTDNLQCEWVGQYDLANEIVLPAKSITTMVTSTLNKLPNVVLDTVVVIKNTNKTVNLTGINDGGDGGQTLTLSAWTQIGGPSLVNTITQSYTSPNTTGTLTISPKTDMTGTTRLYVRVKDNSTSMNGMFNEKVLSVPLYVLPYINKAPTMNDIDDVAYTKSQINTTQNVILTNVTDGNDGKQKLTLTAESEKTWIATVATQGSTLVKITPKAEGKTVITCTVTDDGINAGGGTGSITKSFTVTVGSGINSTDEPLNETVIYPNPAKDKITVKNDGLKYKQYVISDMNGKSVLRGILANDINEVDVDAVAPGVYIIKLISEESASAMRIIIQ